MRGAAELLAVYADAGRGLQRLDDLTFDRQVDLGGEVVAQLGDCRRRPVACDERLRRVVEDHRGLGHQCVELSFVKRHRGLPTHRGERLGQGEASGVERLADDRALDARGRSAWRWPAGRRCWTLRRRR